MAVALESVVKQLADSSIIAPGHLENFVPPKAHPTSVEELVAELVKNNHLTKFQAAQVSAGKTKSLILGEYTILDKIGAGGMGQVYKALHRRMERTVAIKVLPPAMTKDAAAVARFQREVVAAAKLSHPNIVHANDAGQANGVHFLVMEYVEGKDLSATVKKDGPFPVAKAVNFILQAARGLEFAHKKGVVHRDIKPANLLLDSEGTVKILDMGLARIESDGNVAAQAELTGTGAVMGTVDYMAPEQGMSTKHADARADIYSLGCSLYYLLVGKAVYGGETVAAKLIAHHNNPIPELRAECPAVSDQLETVFKKLVAKRIEDRYQTMTEVIADLERLGGNSGTVSNPMEATAAFDPSALAALKGIDVSRTTAKTAATKQVAAVKPSGGKQPPWKNTKVLIGAGAVGLLLLLGVILILRDKDDKEVARIDAADGTKVTLPAGGSVQVQQSQLVPSPTPSVVQPTTKLTPLVGPQPPLAVAPFDAAQAKAHQQAWAKHLGIEVETTNSVGMKMVLIPPGEFMMGSTDEQVEAAEGYADETRTVERIRTNERPQHRVVISAPFLIGSTEVTVAQIRSFPDSQSINHSDQLPANWITWTDAVEFCRWISLQEGATYRLPTEAEWEYACRSGTTTHYSFGDDPSLLERYGWYGGQVKDGLPPPAGAKLPNSFGLHDMHGSLYEWCHDVFDKGYYSNSLLIDPTGPVRGTPRVLRGGVWFFNAAACRSAFRHYDSTSIKSPAFGFRIVRELDVRSTAATLDRPASSPKLFIYDPAFPQWMAQVQALPAEKQVEAVAKKLQELNPGFDGNVTQKNENGVVTELKFLTTNVTDISPLRALAGLKVLHCGGSIVAKGELSDLSPLQGMGLTSLNCSISKVFDLSPLKAMPLTNIDCTRTSVADLSPLEGMPLTGLNCSYSPVTKLSPLFGMRLSTLSCSFTKISDLSPLQGMPLTSLDFSGNGVSDLAPLKGMPLTSLKFDLSMRISDLSPLRGMPLSILDCSRSQVSDLSPLEDCKNLKNLDVVNTKVAAANIAALQKALPNCKIEWDDPAKATTPQPATSSKLFMHDPAFPQWMAQVQAMPAQEQINAVSKKLVELNPGFDGKVTDALSRSSPRIQNDVITEFRFSTFYVRDISPLRALNGLRVLYISGLGGSLSDLSPLKGLPLISLNCDGIKVTDLSPLTEMPLTTLVLSRTPASDLSPLEDCETLTFLNVHQTQITPASVAALQKALPNCKIVWDDPTTATTLQPTTTSKLFMHDPAFPQWMAQVQAMPAEEQIQAVSKKLMELNPGFDGVVTHIVENNVVVSLQFSGNSVSDISPVKALSGLKTLKFPGSSSTHGMVSDLSPLEGLSLQTLYCHGNRISDLSPLSGMPLTFLHLSGTPVSDLSPLQQCERLTVVKASFTSVTAPTVAALQKALPNCKIEWDDPAKATTPQPASGTK